MRSTFAGFTTAQLAMRASQKALDVTGQNIANVNTEGYTRQRLDLISLNNGQGIEKYESQFNVKIGSGVLTKGISQIRDPFLDIRFRTERANVGAEDQKLGILNDLEMIFDEVSKNGVQSQISEMSSMLQKLSSEVGNDEFDSMVKSSSDVLTKMLNQYATQLGGMREEQETDLGIDVVKINDIMKNIQKLNESIKVNNIYGSPALELQDQRNTLIDELSAYVKIDVKYNSKKISDAITVEELEINLVGASGKIPLIKGGFAGEFKVEKDAVNGKMDAILTRPDFDNPGNPPIVTTITDEITSGALKATFDMLNKSGEFDGGSETTRGIGYYEKSLDLLANKLAESFNKANQEPVFDKNGNQITNIVTDPVSGVTTVTSKNKNTGVETSFIPASAPVDKFDNSGNPLIISGQDDLHIPNKEPVFDANGNQITNIVKNAINGLTTVTIKDKITGVETSSIPLSVPVEKFDKYGKPVTTLGDNEFQIIGIETVFDKDGNQITNIVTDALSRLSTVTIKDKDTGFETSFIPASQESQQIDKFDKDGNRITTLGRDEIQITKKEPVFNKDGNQITSVVTDAKSGLTTVISKDKTTGFEISYIAPSQSVDKFDKDGKPVTTLGQNEFQITKKEPIFDKNGNQITNIVRDALSGATTITRKDKTTGIETLFIAPSQSVDKFDKDGKPVTTLGQNEFQITKKEPIFDKNGNQITNIVKDSVSGLTTVTIKDKTTGVETSSVPAIVPVEKFDKDGNTVTTLGDDEFEIVIYEPVFDKDGNQIMDIVTDDTNGLTIVTSKDKTTGIETSFIPASVPVDKFDKDGKPVTTLGDDELEIVINEPVFDKDGNQITNIVTDAASGSSTVTIKDKDTGIVTSFTPASQLSQPIDKFDKDGNLLTTLEQDEFYMPVFDANGNQITNIVTDAVSGVSTVTIKDKTTGAETSFIPPIPPVDKFDKYGKPVTGLGNHEIYIKKDLFASNDGNPITAKNLTISEGWNKGDIGITASTKYGSPLGANDNVLNMISLINEKQEYKMPDKLNPDGTVAASGKKIFNGSFQEMFTNTGSVLALDVKSTKSVLDNYVTVANDIASMRDNVSSVSLDEEGMNILHYQKSYNAAARLMTALDEAINTIIHSMGIVGR